MKTLCLMLILLSVAAPKENKYLVLVNKDNPFPIEEEMKIEKELEPVLHTRKDGRPTQYMQREAALALDALLYAADDAGFNITVTSAYRSREYQQKIYDLRLDGYISAGADSEKAQRLTERYVAPPGHSEHHTGLAVDMHSIHSAETSFADTPEFAWLCENAPKYGFILRYPKGKEEITGYAFEPWHFRYVGACAAEITRCGLTLEEFLKARRI